MFKPHYGKCKQCGESPRLIPTKRGLCQKCDHKNKSQSLNSHKRIKASTRDFRANTPNNARALSSAKLRPKFSKRKISIRKTSKINRKPTGELELFKRLYEERGPYSEVAPYEYVAFDVRCFSHLLSKQSYPSLRLEPENIVIKTPKQHDMWHTQYHKLKHLPEWQWVLEKEQALKQKYYLENKIKKL